MEDTRFRPRGVTNYWLIPHAGGHQPIQVNQRESHLYHVTHANLLYGLSIARFEVSMNPDTPLTALVHHIHLKMSAATLLSL
jgi:hypothetical protein